MSINLLLNFPKIGRMTRDLETVVKAIKYKVSSDKECNFDIDPTNTKIKKRIL